MKYIKDELQNIIFGNEPDGTAGQLKTTQSFLRKHAETSVGLEEKQRVEGEKAALIAFAKANGLIYQAPMNRADFIGAGAEQRVYRSDETSVIKTNQLIFYTYWLDYFNSLLIHNYFFPATAYTFLGLKKIGKTWRAVVRQDFILKTEPTDLALVKEFLAFNGFENNRYEDYINADLGLILEDQHDENVLSKDGILFFIDTVFYLTPEFTPV